MSRIVSYARTSPFFNVFEEVELGPFTRQEAENFVQQKGAQAGFSPLEQERLKRYGRNEPLRLQLAGVMLEADKQVADKTASDFYHPNDPYYWQAFGDRLERQYQGMLH